MIIPEELKPLFDTYRGTGIFNVGDVTEYVTHWKTLRKAQSMSLMEWLNDTLHDKDNGYVDDNIDKLIDIWRTCNEGYIHFSRESALKFMKEGLVDMIHEHYFKYYDNEFSLVKFKGEVK